MEKEKNQSPEAILLRKKAEEQLEINSRLKVTSGNAGSGSSQIVPDTLKLLHELEVLHIELEMQNEELQLAKQKAEHTEKQYEDLYREICDFSPAGYFRLDRDGIIFSLNESGAGLLGEERSFLENKNFRHFVSPDNLTVFNQMFQQIFETGSKHTCELKLANNGNSSIYVHLEGMFNSQQQKFILTAVDITGHKNAEKLQKVSEEKFRQLIANSFDMLVLIDSNGIQHFVSESCEKILGYRPDELINIPVIENMIHPDDREKIIEVFQNAVLIGYGGAQYRHRHKNGGWVYLEAYGTNQINNPGINSIVLNVRDITERKLAEEELKEREEIFRLFLENSPIYIFFKDENIRSLRLSRNYENLIGKSMNELIGKTMDELFPSDLAKSMVENDLDILKNGVKIEIEEEFNERNYSTIKFPIQIEGKPTYLAGFTIDITERKHAEMALKESEARMRELNATKDKFFSIIAHDLRNPFNSIIGFSDLLTKQVQEKDYEGIANYSKIIQNSSQRAMDLLMNLMDWSRMQTGRMGFSPECIDMVELTNEVLKLLNSSVKQKSIVVNTEFPPLAFAMADKKMISTVLGNLISNALKFTHSGGKIVISAEKKQAEWEITIADDGVGIKKEAIDKLFRIDQSYSTMGTQNEKGTGLGLLLCKEFVEKNGGRIWVESDYDEMHKSNGSKFHFTVPKG